MSRSFFEFARPVAPPRPRRGDRRIARWAGLPILPDRIEGGRLVKGHGAPSLLKVEETMVGRDGTLGVYRCYAPGLRRFAILPADDSTDGLWRVSENTIGAMVNPTSLPPQEFAKECYRYLLAREAGERFLARWLDEPLLYPKVLTHPADLAQARRAIPDIRPTETVVYARDLFGSCSYIARMIPGVHWARLDWRTEGGEAVPLVPARGRAAGTVRTWRIFLNRNTFLRHPVPFTLRADGRRSDGETRGLLGPAPILIVGATRTGRTGWASGQRAEDLIPDPNEWARVVGVLAGIPGADLRRVGLDPQTVRAWRGGRRPSRRGAERARRLVGDRARAEAGLLRSRARVCIVQGCTEPLTGRQRLFCRRHATYPGVRRKAWREEHGR